MKITAQSVADSIVLRGKIAEAQFRKSVGLSNESAPVVEQPSLPGISIVYPFENELSGIESALKEFSPVVILSQAKSKSGRSFELLVKRALIIKTNNDNRFEIAKLAIVLAKLSPQKRELIAEIIRAGKIESAIDLTGEESVTAITSISRFLCRCGIKCAISGNLLVQADSTDEVTVTVGYKKIWIDMENKKQMEENLDKLGKLNPLLQMKNAERHVRSFDENEEKEFASIQHQYLELLKAQDDLIKKFEDEQQISVDVPS